MHGSADAGGTALLLQLVGDVAALQATVTVLARTAPPEARQGVAAALAFLARGDAISDGTASPEAALVHAAVRQRAALMLAAVDDGATVAG